MKAFVIVEITIHDKDLYEEYKKLTPASIKAYDGKFAARGGRTETLEGEWKPARVVLLEFPSLKRAKEWWHSPEYSEARAIRQRAATTKMIVVEGAE